MATSGTYSFTMNRDDIITAALRKTQRFGVGDVIPPEDIADCAIALNLLVKEVVIDGMPLWCVQDIAIPMVAGQQTYDVSTASGTTLPLRILDAYIRRNTTLNDVTLIRTSRWDYDTLGQKYQKGVPNQYWYDPQLGNGTIYLYDVPFDASQTVHVVIQRQIQDFNLATDNPDFPQEAYRMLVWLLADEIALDYSTPKDVRLEINQKAQGFRDKFFDSPLANEQASTTFTPSERGNY